MRLSANLSLMFREHPFLDRFSAAASAGFTHVECQFLDEEADVGEVAAALADAGLVLDLFNAPRGGAHEFGLALSEDDRFDEALHWARDAALELGCKKVHVLSGLALNTSGQAEAIRFARIRDAYARADAMLAPVGVTTLVEPLNPIDRPGYWLNSLALGEMLVAVLNRESVRLQFDAYHVARMGMEAPTELRRLRPVIGHIQIAGARDRGEPDKEREAAPVFEAAESIGYRGCIGLEYSPRARTEAGLAWAQAWLGESAILFHRH